jgi:hypothetical protein
VAEAGDDVLAAHESKQQVPVIVVEEVEALVSSPPTSPRVAVVTPKRSLAGF